MEERKLKTTCGHEFMVIPADNGKVRPHSTSRPAAIYPDGREEYYLYGIKYDKQNWDLLVKLSKKTLSQD